METLPEVTSKHAGKCHHFPRLLSPWLFLALAACGAPRGKSDRTDESPGLKKEKKKEKQEKSILLDHRSQHFLFEGSKLLGAFSSCVFSKFAFVCLS